MDLKDGEKMDNKTPPGNFWSNYENKTTGCLGWEIVIFSGLNK